MKFTDGENTFRVLTPAIIGFEYWTVDKKPIRSESYPEAPTNIRKDSDIKHFWAFVVWNYEEKRVQILEITQKTIMDAVRALIMNAKWGDPTGYDISVTRAGTGLDTEYQIVPNPHSTLTDEITDAFKAKKINLRALYVSGDPFDETTKYPEEKNPDDIPF